MQPCICQGEPVHKTIEIKEVKQRSQTDRNKVRNITPILPSSFLSLINVVIHFVIPKFCIRVLYHSFLTVLTRMLSRPTVVTWNNWFPRDFFFQVVDNGSSSFWTANWEFFLVIDDNRIGYCPRMRRRNWYWFWRGFVSDERRR